MTNLNYFLWLQMALGPGASNTGLIFETFDTPEEIYKLESYDRKVSGVFTAVQIRRMEEVEITDTYEVIAQCASAGVDIITFKDDAYPEKLRFIPDFPIVLYVKGDLSALKEKIPFAIVGTRKASGRSVAAASELAKALSRCGFVIISGGALGVDSAAHTGALCAGEKTICVLGTGILCKYLKENEPLRDVISANGALVSEFLPDTQGAPWTFPIRNRIISGMSEGVAVIEGKETSGSINTAKHAADQGRDVFAIPSLKLGSASKGCDNLLADGAIKLEMPLDVVGQYMKTQTVYIDEEVDLSIDLTMLGVESEGFHSEIRKLVKTQEEKDTAFRDRKKPKKRDITDSLSEDAIRLYGAFGRDPLSIKQLSEKVIMPVSSLLGALTELEIFGYIELLPNTKYSVK